MDNHYTKEEGGDIASRILSEIVSFVDKATVVGLSGDLGAGKTTLVQEIASLLGIEEPVLSPTFVIAKRYATRDPRFQSLVHIDAYRIDTLDELGPLGWEALIKEDGTLVVIEWPERIEEALPNWSKRYHISHDGEGRHITHV